MLCGIKVKIMCKFKGVVTSEKGLLRTRNHLDLVISASSYY